MMNRQTTIQIVYSQSKQLIIISNLFFVLVFLILLIGKSVGFQNREEIQKAFQKIVQQMKENEIIQHKNDTSEYLTLY